MHKVQEEIKERKTLTVSEIYFYDRESNRVDDRDGEIRRTLMYFTYLISNCNKAMYRTRIDKSIEGGILNIIFFSNH